jgi:hypothetical protein
MQTIINTIGGIGAILVAAIGFGCVLYGLLVPVRSGPIDDDEDDGDDDQDRVPNLDVPPSPCGKFQEQIRDEHRLRAARRRVYETSGGRN